MARACLIPILAIASLCPAASLAQDWTGWYLGAHVGSSRADTTTPSSGRGANYGVHLGYHHELASQWVVGGEFEYNQSDIALDGDDRILGLCRLKGIVGRSAGDWLPYAAAGVGKFRTEDLGEDFNWMASVGVTYRVTEHYSIGAEFAYQEHQNVNNTGIDAEANSATIRISFRF